MTYQLKLNDGTTVSLSFSLYFLNKLCKLAGVGLTQIFQYVMGDISGLDQGVVNGGYLDDLDIRAQIIAAGMEASERAHGNPVSYTMIEGYEVMEKMEQSLISHEWTDIGLLLTNTMFPSGLPKDDVKKNAEESQEA